MIKIYTVYACASCEKAKKWLRENNLKFEEINLLKSGISSEELFEILSLTEEGVEEIISKRSKVYKKLSLNYEQLTLNELIKIIISNPTLLRRPLILDEKRLQVGYNTDDIRKFLTRTTRRMEMNNAIETIRKSI